MQATFPVDKKASFQATRIQFPLTLVWGVKILKFQGLTLPEIVIDIVRILLVFRKLLYTDLFDFLLTSVPTSTFPSNFFSLELSYPYMILMIPKPNH